MTTKVIVNPNNPDVSDLWKDVPLTDASGNPQVDSQGRIVCRRYVVRGSVGISAEEASSMVTNAVSNTVKVTGDQTIAGDKTFTGSVTVPTPTANTNPVTKKYVDDAIAEVADSANISVVDAEPVSQNNKTVIAYPSPNRLNPLAASIGPSVLWNYSATRDYSVGSIVVSNNRMYLSLTANGPGSTVVIPGTNPAVWALVPIESELHAGRLIDELVYSISPLTDSSLHLADGSLIAKGAYAQYYNKKLVDWQNADIVANAREIGSLTNNNGVYSGFSSANYLRTQAQFNHAGQPWDIQFKVTTGSDVVSSNVILSACVDNVNTGALLDLYVEGSHFHLDISNDASSANIGASTSTYTVLANTTYWLRLIFDGNSYVLYYSLDGSNYASAIGISSSATLWTNLTFLIGLAKSGAYPWQGSIDFNSSFILLNGSFNGSTWWQGATKRGFTNEFYYQAMISTFGSCGKFVLNTTAETVRLPKLTHFIEGTVDLRALSELSPAGAPNITAVLHDAWGQHAGVAGAFTLGTVTARATQAASGSDACSDDAYFSAANSNPIYGNSNTIQPQSIFAYVYIVIANVQKTAIAVDIDNVMTDVNLKADKDFGNITSTAKEMMSVASMPSTNITQLSIGSSGSQYIAPADGYFSFFASPTSATAAEITLSIPNRAIRSTNCHGTGWGMRVFVPCPKGSIMQINYTNINTSNSQLYFVKSVGSV